MPTNNKRRVLNQRSEFMTIARYVDRIVHENNAVLVFCHFEQHFWFNFRKIGGDISKTFSKLEKLTMCKCSYLVRKYHYSPLVAVILLLWLYVDVSLTLITISMCHMNSHLLLINMKL